MVELTLLVRALRDAGSEYAGLEGLTALVRAVGARPDRRHAPRPSRGQLLAGAFLFAAAYRTPEEDPAEHRRLQRLVDVRLLDALEQPVHRVMEDRLALEWAGLRHSLPSWQVLADGSILGAKPNPAFMDEVAAYQLTHVVMYLTAFGSRPPSSPRRARPAESTAHLDAAGPLRGRPALGPRRGTAAVVGPPRARVERGVRRRLVGASAGDRPRRLRHPATERGGSRPWSRARRVVPGPLPPDPGDRSRSGCVAEGLRTAASSVQRSCEGGRGVRPA